VNKEKEEEEKKQQQQQHQTKFEVYFVNHNYC
jgi:hypothetical protein